MRTIFSIIAFFSFCTLQAQAPEPSHSKELPATAITPYPTAAEASEADGEGRNDNRYRTYIADWQQQGELFTAPFTVSFAWANRQVVLRLGPASSDYEVRVNGNTVARNSDANHPADFNITRYTKEGSNQLEVLFDTTPATATLESWRDTPTMPKLPEACLISPPTMRIRDVVVKTWRAEGQDSTARAEVGIVVRSNALNPRSSRIHYQLMTPQGKQVAAGHKDMTLDMRREDTLRFLIPVPDSMLWSPEYPTRYTLRLSTQHEGRFVEYIEVRPGFRTLEVRNAELIINGKAEQLHAYNIKPQDITEEQIWQLREQGYNTLRLLPGAASDALYTMCDREGFYVIAQAPINSSCSGASRRIGGNPTNTPEWLGAYIERTENSFHTAKGHPSVVAFSIASESANGINLYESYLNIKSLNDSRPVLYPNADGEWNNDKLTIEPLPNGFAK